MILIVVEHLDGKLRKSAAEMVAAGRLLADGLGTDLVGLVLGQGSGTAAEALADLLPTVLHAEHSELAAVRAEPYTRVIAQAARERDAQAVVMAASRSGLSIAPRVALQLDAALLEDVTGLEVVDGRVQATRLSYLSRVTETVRARTLPVVVTVKPNLFAAAEGGAGGAVEALEPALEPHDTRVRVGERAAAVGGRVALEEADVVVTGGRGVGGPEGFETLVEPLADALNAGIGSTRAVVDAGWRPYAEQVGQTGKTVAPEVYFALGVSGAVQHLSGMNRSKVIVAVNKDPDAPIFKVSDYGIVGDVNAVVPELKKALEERDS